MKTVQQVRNEIADIELRLSTLARIQAPTDDDRREGKRLSRKLSLLRERKMYLESGPTELYLIEKRNAICNKLDKIRSTAAAYKPPPGVDPKKHLNTYHAEMNVPQLTAQLETLEY